MVLALVSATSYQYLCAVEIVHCYTCEKYENDSNNQQEFACKLCEKSKDIEKTALKLNKTSAPAEKVLASIDYAPVGDFLVTAPEFIMATPQAPPAVTTRTLTHIIKTSIAPIRGPSIVV